jgi:hypothetical protein
MGAHHRITIATGMPIYFADPASPWQPLAARLEREHCECGGGPGGLVRQGGCRQHEVTLENTGRLAACLALDLSSLLPAPTWPTRLGLIRSLSVSGRDPSQCCRDR